MKLIIYGEPRTKKNSQRVIPMRGKNGATYSRILPSKAYEQYEADCVRQITGDKRIGISYQVNVKVIYYMATHRIIDLVNLLEATDDILVAAGVLEDDNIRIVAGHDFSRVLYDKENPRAEITITKM